MVVCGPQIVLVSQSNGGPISRVDRPRIRRRDHKLLGTLNIIRTDHASFVDERGKRRSSPVVRDHLPDSLKDAKGEDVTALAVSMDKLPPDTW